MRIMKIRDLKDLIDIYEDWPNADIKVWMPSLQKEYELVFSGSENKGENNRKLNFIAIPKEKSDPVLGFLYSFEETLKKIFPNISEDTLKDYSKLYLEEIVKKIHKND